MRLMINMRSPLMPATKGTGAEAAEGLSAAGGGSEAGSRLFLSRRRGAGRILHRRYAGIIAGRGNRRALLLRDERQSRDDAVMNADDLQKALSGVQTIAQRYG